MILKVISVITVSLLTAATSYACSCIPVGGDFFETVSNHNEKVRLGEWPSAMELTVVSAEVIGYMQLRAGPLPTEMVLDIDGIFQGSVDQQELVVEGDNGAQCRPYVTRLRRINALSNPIPDKLN